MQQKGLTLWISMTLLQFLWPSSQWTDMMANILSSGAKLPKSRTSSNPPLAPIAQNPPQTSATNIKERSKSIPTPELSTAEVVVWAWYLFFLYSTFSHERQNSSVKNIHTVAQLIFRSLYLTKSVIYSH